MFKVIDRTNNEYLTSKEFVSMEDVTKYVGTIHPDNHASVIEISDSYKAILEAIDAEVSPGNLEALDAAENGNDWAVELDDGREFRLITEYAIDRIHNDEIVELVNDCMLDGASDICKRYFNYDSFVRDCRMGDGYGHHFSQYDGSEENASGYYIFRIG